VVFHGEWTLELRDRWDYSITRSRGGVLCLAAVLFEEHFEKVGGDCRGTDVQRYSDL